MNFFFGIKNNLFSSEINIPKFNYNNKKLFTNHKIYKATPNNKHWKISKIDCSDNDEL